MGAASRVTWFEVLGSNVKATKKFYEDALGWTVRPFSEHFDGYLLAQTGALKAGEDEHRGIDGGFGTFAGYGFKKALTINTMEVTSIDDTLARVEKSGGNTVWGPEAMPGVGTTAYCKDSTGVVFGLLQRPADHETPEGNGAEKLPAGQDGELGRIVHFEVISEDPKKSVSFYREVLGWNIDEPLPMPNGQKYWICLTGPAEPPKPSAGSPFINGGITGTTVGSGHEFEPCTINISKVASAAEAEEKIIKAGGKKVTGFEMPGVGIIAYFEDPMGVVFGIQQPPEASTEVGSGEKRGAGVAEESEHAAPLEVKRRKTTEG